MPFGIGEPHVETHINNKPNVVESEGIVLNQIPRGENDILLGVCGNANGWNQHEAQYTNLGFNLNNVIVCEMNKITYFSLLFFYLNNILNLNINVGPTAPGDLPNEFYRKIRDKECQIGYSSNREYITFIQAIGHPALMWGTLDYNGITPMTPVDKNTYGRLNLQTKFNRTTHVDFDITSKTTTAGAIIDEANSFYAGYPNLRSLVQVHEFKRGLEAVDAAEQAATNEYNRLKIEEFVDVEWFDTLQDTAERTKNAIWEGIYRINAGGTRGQTTSNQIQQGLNQHDISSYIQVYTGAGGGGMISITSTRGRMFNPEIDVQFDPGYSNIGPIKTAINKSVNYPELHQYLINLLGAIE